MGVFASYWEVLASLTASVLEMFGAIGEYDEFDADRVV